MKPQPGDIKDGEFLERGLRSIPRRFHSVFTGKPFETCATCSTQLLRPGQQYVIEKHFVGSEAVMEYALCEKCANDLCEGFSKESSQNIEARMEQAFTDYLDVFGLDEAGQLAGLPERCLLCRQHARSKACHERTVIGGFRGRFLEVSAALPLMICNACMEEVVATFSEQTRRHLDDFANVILDFPPDLQDLPKRPTVLFV